MRTIRNIFFAAVLLTVLAACGEQKKQNAGKTAPESTEPESVFTAGPPPEMSGSSTDNGKTESGSLGSLRLDIPETMKPEKPVVKENRDHILRMTEQEAESAAAIRQPRNTKWKVVSGTEKADGTEENSSTAQGQTEAQAQPGSAADLLKESGQTGTRLLWQPQEVLTLHAPVRLPDAAISPDRSVIVFVETTGATEGPFGSRLILMNTANWKILRILELRERMIRKIVWVPGTLKLAALCTAQPALDQKYGLAVFDLQTGTETGFIQIPEGMGDTAFLADSRCRIILSHGDLPELVVIPADSLNPESKIILKTEKSNMVAAISADGKYLAAVPSESGKRISIYKTSDLQPFATEDLPSPLTPKQLFFLGNPSAFYLCGKTAQGSAILKNGQLRHLDGLSSGFGTVSENGKTIYHLQLNAVNRISVIDVQSGAEKRGINTNKTEPKLEKPGAIREFFLIPAIQGLAILDANGNFYLVSIESERGRHGERAIIFQRSGSR